MMPRYVMERPEDGQIIQMAVADPAVGSDFSVSVPSGGPTERWVVHHIKCSYHTDSNAATRVIRFFIGGCEILMSNDFTTINANYRFQVGWGNYDNWNKYSSGLNHFKHGMAPVPVMNGEAIYSSFINMQAGDYFENIYLWVSKFRVH